MSLSHNLTLLEHVVDIIALPPACSAAIRFHFLLQVPERVRAMNASIKLLLIVREPVTRAISDYTQLRSHAATAILPLAESSSSSSSSSSGGAPGSGYGARMPATQSTLYTKLQAAHGYDNALGSGAGAKETAMGMGGGKRRGTAATTTTTPTPSAAQLAAK